MARAQQARVYSPPPETAPRAYAPSHDDAGGQRPWLILAIMVIVLVTGGYVLWSMYGESAPAGDDAPVIAGPEGGFKERYQGPPLDELATAEIDRVLAGETAAAPKAAPRNAPLAEEPLPEVAPPPARTAAARPAQKAPPARVAPAASGGYVAQIASLRSEAAAATAWDRLAARDPALFAGARQDLQRADLGEKGVYFRVRAGYFSDRDEAARFCERVKALGQDCLVVAR